MSRPFGFKRICLNLLYDVFIVKGSLKGTFKLCSFLVFLLKTRTLIIITRPINEKIYVSKKNYSEVL